MEEEWPSSVKSDFEILVDQKINQVAQFPKSCKESKKKEGIYMAVIEEHNSFYFRLKEKHLEILIFVDTRMNPSKSKKQLKKFKD